MSTRIVTATLPRRQCRVQFVSGSKVVNTSRPYNSGNTWRKDNCVCAHEAWRHTVQPAEGPEAIAQVLTGDVWVVDKTNE